jgi:serine/threonine protein kinase
MANVTRLEQAPVGVEEEVREKEGDSEHVSKSFHSHYLLLGVLGKGAFAQVHLCSRVVDGSVTGKELAVKITDLRKKGGQNEIDPRTRRAVEKEVHVMRKVGNQTYCVHQKEAFLEGFFTYIVMEKCDMTLLQALETSKGLTENVLGKVVRDMLKGLAQIHKMGIVHRDVKPDNFLCLGDPMVVKLCDFGLAAILLDPPELSGVYGTAPFMSPEMLKSIPYNTNTDLWSVGVVAYVMLFGEFPYTPAESTSKAMKAAIVAGVPAPPFEPKASLQLGGVLKISEEATTLARLLLSRDADCRPTAEDALLRSWVCPREGREENWGSYSLRPMLYSAKRVGAFDTRNVQDSASYDIDRMMSHNQAKYHKHLMHTSHNGVRKVTSKTPSTGSSTASCHKDKASQKDMMQSDVSTGVTNTSSETDRHGSTSGVSHQPSR